jgi:hypothetical protein
MWPFGETNAAAMRALKDTMQAGRNFRSRVSGAANLRLFISANVKPPLVPKVPRYEQNSSEDESSRHALNERWLFTGSFKNTPLGPDEIQRLVAAYQETLRALHLKDRDDPITRIVARKYSRSPKPALKTRRRFPSSR